MLAGAAFAAFALFDLADASNPRRFGNAAFWGLLAVSFLAGDRLGDLGNGLLVLAPRGHCRFGGLGQSAKTTPIPEAAEQERAAPHGNWLVPAGADHPGRRAWPGPCCSRRCPALVDAKQVTLVSLAFGVLLALAIGMPGCEPPASCRCRKGGD